MKKKLLVLLLLPLLLAGCGSTSSSSESSHSSSESSIAQSQSSQSTGSQNSSQSASQSNTTTNADAYTQLAQMTYQSGQDPVSQINHGQSTLNPQNWQTEKIDYGNLDRLNRTTTDTAYLSDRNLGKSAGRPAQNFKPTGWHNQPKYVNGKRLYPLNRGHLIGYTLSFNINDTGQYEQGAEGSSDNPKNLASQSDFSNKNTMQDYEEKVRTALEQHKKVIYQVTTVFRGDELMPRGYWSQAVSTDGSLNFNVYIWNVEPGLTFDYATGQSQVDNNMQVPYSGRARDTLNTGSSDQSQTESHRSSNSGWTNWHHSVRRHYTHEY